MYHNQFESLGRSHFVDGHGNFRSDMETSRSKVAVRKRIEIRLSDLRAQIEPLRYTADSVRRNAINRLRAKGRSKETLALHAKADRLDAELAPLEAEVQKLTDRLGVL